jgi:hypothetical protein
MACNVIQSDISSPMLQRNMLSPSSRSKNKSSKKPSRSKEQAELLAGFLPGLFVGPEYGDNMLL